MPLPLFDDLADPKAWQPVASGEAVLRLGRDRKALRLDFDFHGGGGFVVARRLVTLKMPESFALTFRVRGECEGNYFELKLEDPTRCNVWWHSRKDFQCPHQWHSLSIQRRDIEFAWGPMGGGAVDEVGAIEFAIVAGKGGRGTVWIADLEMEDRSVHAPQVVTTSSAIAGCEAGLALLADDTCWRSVAGDVAPWWQVDFQGQRELGSLAIHWGPEHEHGGFAVEASPDGEAWETVWPAHACGGRTSYVRMPDRPMRAVRLNFAPLQRGRSVTVRHIDVKPMESGRTQEAFLHAVAADVPRGWMPRYWLREQSYWTSIGTPEGGPCPLINEEGMVEVDRGSFSLEPFIFADGRLFTWADAPIEVSLAEGWLPLPQVNWSLPGLELQIAACVVGRPGARVLHVRYRVANPTDASKSLRLLVAMRPFQVTPPWQSFRTFGGVSAIREVRLDSGSVCINGSKVLRWSRAQSAAGAIAFAHGMLTDLLAQGVIPSAEHVTDEIGLGSVALAWDLAVPAHDCEVVELTTRLEDDRQAQGELRMSEDAFAEASEQWRSALGTWNVLLPTQAERLVDAWRTAAAHILIHREGAALQPGPRRYTRCWIRDAAVMAAALLRSGRCGESRALLRWYAGFQREDGFVPCCVDGEGPDWLVEHDSHGQFIYALRQHFRFTGDVAFLKELWPAARRAVDAIERLRKTRLTDEFASPDKRARFGLLPESVSHEGYLAQPVHAYWDDFWALRGLRDAAAMAEALGDATSRSELRELCADFERTLGDSLLATIKEKNLAYVPGSVEWADFDPTATANAIALLDDLPGVPERTETATFEMYLAGFRDRVAGRTDWSNYSPYEIRIVGAFVRHGRRDDALELLNYFLANRRPLSWNQWPEIAWRDMRSPGNLGDVPHTWIAAEYVLAARSLFVHERDSEHALVLAAGVPLSWLEGDGISVEALPTPYGPLSFALRQTGLTALSLTLLAGLAIPPGGFIVEAPAQGQITSLVVNGKPASLNDAGRVVVRECPAEIGISWAPLETVAGAT